MSDSGTEFICGSYLVVKYFPDHDIMALNSGPRPGYIWRSIWGVRRVIEMGSRWVIGSGSMLNILAVSMASHACFFSSNNSSQIGLGGR